MRQAKRQLLDEQFHAQFPEVEQPLAAGSSSAANPDFLAGVAAPTITGLPPSPARPLFPQLDVEIVRKTLPFLQDLPDDYLRAHSYDQLVAANATLAKMEDKSASAAIGKRLTANYNELKAKPIKVEAGWDDCISLLHEARFLPGFVCTLARMWERAQEVVPDSGLRPLCCYDLVSVGLNTCVSTKGWVELHDPGSLSISIKFFLPTNVCLADRASSRTKLSELLTIEDQLVEPSSIKELRQGLLAASVAQRLVTPWNFSITAILGFLTSTDFCQNQLVGQKNQPALLREFIDLILHINASNWKVKRSFLTATDIQGHWNSFTLQKGIFPPAPGQAYKSEAGGQSKRFDSSPSKSNPKVQLASGYRNICIRYNLPGGCPSKAKDSCEVGKPPNKYVLQHLCLQPKGGGACLGAHSATEHASLASGGN